VRTAREVAFSATSIDWCDSCLLSLVPESVAGMDTLPFDRPCLTCHAKPTEPCKNEQGMVIRGVHPERWEPKSHLSQASDGHKGHL
jgi:hypothetical protein